MSRKQCLIKLQIFMDEKSTKENKMFLRNSFAICCYLIKNGEAVAAKKQLSNLFKFLGENNRQTYFSEIKDSISDYADEYASEIFANAEINNLFKEKAN